jgi:hypothetical protein
MASKNSTHSRPDRIDDRLANRIADIESIAASASSTSLMPAAGLVIGDETDYAKALTPQCIV